MMKLILCVAIICFGGFVGMYFSSRYKNRVTELNQCELMLTKIRVYIKSEHIKTNELLDRLSNSESLNRLSFLKLCRDRLSYNKNFPVIWNESLDQALPALSLKKEDMLHLRQLSEVVGSCDANGVEAAVDILQQEIGFCINNAVEQSKTTGRLCTKLGFLSALAVAIIFI